MIYIVAWDSNQKYRDNMLAILPTPNQMFTVPSNMYLYQLLNLW